MPEGNECCTCLSMISLDSVVKINNDYYPQIFLEECKYAIKKKKSEWLKHNISLDLWVFLLF